jgi:hypothetical protein
MKFGRPFLRLALIPPTYWSAFAAEDSKAWVPDIPKTWDKTELAGWATPVAGLNARPSHISPDEYYSMPVANSGPIRFTCPAGNRKATGKCCSTSGPSR